MTIHAKYVGVAVILMALYLFTLWFETIHKLCLMGSVINILINYQFVNPLKKRLILKSETESHDNDLPELSVSMQFSNLCKGFRVAAIGYVLTLGVVPYNFYILINPEKNLETFKVDMINFYKKVIEQTKNNK